MSKHNNRLIHESSPYLRQHAHNPVDWYPWGAEAMEAARRQNKPILLSVGYSACHWCHVMERESFEDEATAQLMNDCFVNIKVDREERPDVDHIYMNAVQLLTGRGGWPMTVFLTPDGKPFYGGTYFPPEDRHGLPSFTRLLRAVAQAYREKPEDVQKTVGQLMTALEGPARSQPAPHSLDAALVAQAAVTLSQSYDDVYGGLGQVPKFPNEAVFDLFLRVYCTSGEQRYLDMVLHTLRRMARGGIYDQIGGGFHRYSVDARWLVPHFEKMLYDNAQLVPLYLSAYQITGDRFFAGIAEDILTYVARELRASLGGFYSAQDADSDGVEGQFYLWDAAEVGRLLGEDVREVACRYWDITEEGNFEGRNIPHVTLDIEEIATVFRRDAAEVWRMIAAARATLCAARARRVAPAVDDKILTSWNALMISACATAAQVLDDGRYRQMAVDAVAFIDATLRRGDRLLSTYASGVAKLNGYLDDYAFYVAALLDVFEATQDASFLRQAATLADSMIAHFWDSQAGGFFFTSDDHEALIVRSKPTFDGSIPSGNSVAARSLLRLYHYTDHAEYLSRAESTLRLFAGHMRQQPFGLAAMLCAADLAAQGPLEIVVAGHPDADDTAAMLRNIRHVYVPNRTLTVISPGCDETLLSRWRGKVTQNGRPTVYVCRGMTCSPPATDWADVERLLRP